MSETVCAGCGTLCHEDQLNFSDAGQVCDACLTDQEADEMLAAQPMGGAWVQLGLGVAAASGIISMSSRSIRSFSTTVAGVTTTTVTHDLDASALAIAIFALVMLWLALVGAVRGSGVQRVALILAAVAAMPVAAYQGYQAMPRSHVTETGLPLSCSEGNMELCNSAGVDADKAGDLEVAAGFFDSACMGDLALGCRNLGYVRSRMTSPDWTMVLAAQKRGCELDDVRACNGAAEASDKLGDQTGRLNFYTRACSLNSGLGCSNQAVVLSKQDPIDMEAVYQAYKKGCALEYDHACLMAHATLNEGTPAADRIAEVRELVNTGCGQGLPEACTAYGVMLDNAQGGARDKPAAQVAFAKACSAENPHALGCFNAGLLADAGEAEPFFRKACDLGEARGCARLTP